MILPKDIQAAICAKLEEVFPGETVYQDLVQSGFTRPSNLVELGKISLDPLSLGNGAVSLRYEFKLTTFCEVDQVHNSHLPTLDLRAMMIMGAFAAGYLKVADLAPKVTSLAADTSLYDAAEVHLVLTLTVDRKDFLPETLVEIMQTLNTRFVDKKEEST